MFSLKVLDTLSLAGSADRPNDDAHGHLDRLVFVLDGATGLGDEPLMPGASDAAWVSGAVRDGLLAHGEGFAGDLAALVFKALTAVKARFEAERFREDFARYEIPWSTLVLLGVTNNQVHIAYLGDSRILIRDEKGHVHHFGAPLVYRHGEQQLAQKMIAASAGKAIGVDTIRATVMPQLRRSRERVNTPEGYWLAGPDPRSAHHLALTSLAIAGPSRALLMTDGLYALVDDYKVYDDAGLLKAAESRGLKALGEELRAIENGDPAGARFPRMKKSDDATGVLVEVLP